MKHRAIASSVFVVCVSFLVPYAARAAGVDADAAKALAKENGCLRCHSVTKTKTGPSYQKVAAMYKGKADGEKKIIEFITTGPKVKLPGGSEAEHPIIGTTDKKELKNLADWILAQ